MFPDSSLCHHIWPACENATAPVLPLAPPQKCPNQTVNISLVILYIMTNNNVCGVVPRGFSRYYVLDLLKTEPLTGKQIIDRASEQSQGMWKPSPGLVYPLLGRLLDEKLVEEVDGGKYQLTEKGVSTAQDIDKINESIKKQLDVLIRLSNTSHFVAMDIIERMASIGSMLCANMKHKEAVRYRKFLESELKKLNQRSEKKEEDDREE